MARTRFALLAIGFETGLLLVALAIGWCFGLSPLSRISREADWFVELLVGIGAAGPLFLGLLAIERWPFGPLRSLLEVVNSQLVPLFQRLSLLELALLSLAAGVGEEVLFRGLLQDGLADWIGGRQGVLIAICLASVAFGLAHSITPAYVVLATLVGVYLGWLMVVTGSLIPPIVAHAAYDFVALVYLTRQRKKKSGPNLSDRS